MATTKTMKTGKKPGSDKVDFKQFAGAFGGKWKTARDKSEESDFADLPDGVYLAQCMGVSVGQFGAKNTWKLLWKFRALKGDFHNTTFTRFENLEGDESLVYVARNLRRFGYDVSELEIEEIEEVLKEISKQKPVCRIRAKENAEGYVNYYIQSVFDEDKSAEVLAEADEDNDDGTADVDDDSDAKPAKAKTKKAAPKDDDDSDDDDSDDADDPDSDDDDSDSDDEDEKPAPKKAKGKGKEPAPKADDDDDSDDADADPDADEDEVELKKGMRVATAYKGTEVTGKIVALDPDAEELTLTLLDGKYKGKKITVSPGDVEALDGD